MTIGDPWINALVDLIAERVAERLEQPEAERSPYLTADEAAEYMRCRKQRIYDLASQGKIKPARDGSRILFSREALDDYLGRREYHIGPEAQLEAVRVWLDSPQSERDRLSGIRRAVSDPTYAADLLTDASRARSSRPHG